jgi:hypothetical protein
MSGLSRDEINRIIYDNGLFHGTMALGVVMDADHLERFTHLVAAAEREACAKILDDMAAKDRLSNYFQVAAIAIRARGNDAT